MSLFDSYKAILNRKEGSSVILEKVVEWGQCHVTKALRVTYRAV